MKWQHATIWHGLGVHTPAVHGPAVQANWVVNMHVPEKKLQQAPGQGLGMQVPGSSVAVQLAWLVMVQVPALQHAPGQGFGAQVGPKVVPPVQPPGPVSVQVAGSAKWQQATMAHGLGVQTPAVHGPPVQAA